MKLAIRVRISEYKSLYKSDVAEHIFGRNYFMLFFTWKRKLCL